MTSCGTEIAALDVSMGTVPVASCADGPGDAGRAYEELPAFEALARQPKVTRDAQPVAQP